MSWQYYVKIGVQKFIDWKVFVGIWFGLGIVYLLIYFGLVPSSIQGYAKIVSYISPFISRKLLCGVFYFRLLRRFHKVLSSKINTEASFKRVWSQYRKIFRINSGTRMGLHGIYVAYYVYMLILDEKLRWLQVNQQTDTIEKDKSFRENLLFYTFSYQVSSFVCSYNSRQPSVSAIEAIEKPLSQISFEPLLIDAIKSCHIDGEGFLSTLTLMLLVLIYLRLPDEKKALVVKSLKSVSNLIHKIGWLNRKMVETIIATSMMESLSPERKLQELETSSKKAKRVTEAEKWDFRNNVLESKISQLRLEHGD